MRICTDWLTGFYRRLGETGIHSISMNETWTGVGVAREHFVEFMKPYDAECVQAAHDAGYMVSFHNCGGRRSSSRTSPTRDRTPWRPSPPASSGDVDLADAKQRIGDRVCLFGGFNEHLLHEGDADDVRAEVQRCLDAAMGGGGYVLGQIFDAKPGLIEPCASGARSRSLQLSGRHARPLRRPHRRRRTDRCAPADGRLPARQPVGRRLRPLAERRHGVGSVEGRAGSIPDPLHQGSPGRRRPVALGYHTGHWEVGLLVREAALELDRLGGLPFAAADPCDGRSQGTTGMFDSLPYRNDAAIVLRRLVRSLPRRRG